MSRTASSAKVDKVLLPISEIRRDGGTQSRAELSREIMEEYSERYDAGVALPPVVVFHDGSSYWLADGFHRVGGAELASLDSLPAEIHQGTQRDAILYSVGANAKHGLRRTNADKRRAVEMLLRDEEWSKKSDRWIADQCGVGHPFVAKIRPALESDSNAPATRETKDGRQYPTERRAPERGGDKWDCAECGGLHESSHVECPRAPFLEGDRAPAESAPKSRPRQRQSEPPADTRDPESALMDLDADIRAHMENWEWAPGRFVACLEAWARRAKSHFEEQTETE